MSDFESMDKNLNGSGGKKSTSLCWVLWSIANFSLLGAILLVGLKSYGKSGDIQDMFKQTDSTDPGLINLSFVKTNVAAYHKSEAFDRDLAALTGDSTDYFSKNGPEASIKAGRKPAVVFDVDETLLSNYPEMNANDYGYIAKLDNAWLESMKSKAFPQTKDFLLALKKQGFHIIIITGRPEAQRAATTDNLKHQGLRLCAKVGDKDCELDTIILRNAAEQKKGVTATQYKSNRRHGLTMDEDYDIMGCIGDQISDCTGGFAGYIMKIPNYAYFLN